jgi:hypothetical protein
MGERRYLRIGKIQEIERSAGRYRRRIDDFDVVVTSFTDFDDDPERAYMSVEGAARGELVLSESFWRRGLGSRFPRGCQFRGWM